MTKQGSMFGLKGLLLALLMLVLTPPSGAFAQVMEVLHSFSGCAPTGCADGDDGGHPKATLAKDTAGNFFGVTEGGFQSGGLGTIFRITPAGVLSSLFSFATPNCFLSGSPGAFPAWSLERATDGAFYGATEQCGLFGDGTLFRMTSAGVFTKLHDFDLDGTTANNGGVTSGLLQGTDGLFYGVTLTPAPFTGRIYRRNADGTLTTLHSFTGLGGDGSHPSGNLMLASDGNIYGTTELGGSAPGFGLCGSNGCGSVFKITADGTVTMLHAFDGTIGSRPVGDLVQGTDGALYGTNASGGNGCGTVFRLTMSGTASLVRALTTVDGCTPMAGLLRASDERFYGTTTGGGAGGRGTIFRLTPEGQLSVLHDFIGPQEGRPFGGLVEGDDGHLYGTTYEGGTHNLGVVLRFRLFRAQDDVLDVIEDIPSNGTLVAVGANNAPTTFSIVSNGSKGTTVLTDPVSGAFTYTPNPDATGEDSFTFKAINVSEESNVAAVTVTITPVNDAAVAMNGTSSTTVGVPVSGILNVTDIDGDTLTTSIVTNGSKGTAVITNATTGAYTYTPSIGESGADIFTFRAHDGTAYSNTAIVTITIASGSNQPPTAHDFNLTTLEDRSAPGRLSATEPEGGSLTYAIVSNGLKGTATITDPSTGRFRYVPNRNANGNDSFTFRANDGQLNSNVATVLVTITPVNDAPVAERASYCVVANSFIVGTLKATDADGDALTFTITTFPQRSSVRITNAQAGTFRFNPDIGIQHGTAIFTFSATDPSGESDSAAVSVRVVNFLVGPNCR